MFFFSSDSRGVLVEDFRDKTVFCVFMMFLYVAVGVVHLVLLVLNRDSFFVLCRDRLVYSDNALWFCSQVTSSSCYSPVVKRTCFPSSDSDDQVNKPRQMQLSIPAEEEAAAKRLLLTSCGISLGWTSSRSINTNQY